MICVLCLIALLVLFLVTPLGIRFAYDQSGAGVWLRVGFINTKLYPVEKKRNKKKKKQVKSNADNFEKVKESKEGGSVLRFLPLLEDLLEFLSAFRKKLCVNYLYVDLNLGGGDPADLAVNYGKTWAMIGNLMPRLEQFLFIKKRDIRVNCDFTAGSTEIYVDSLLTVTVGRLLGICLTHGTRILKKFIQIIKNSEGGVNINE